MLRTAKPRGPLARNLQLREKELVLVLPDPGLVESIGEEKALNKYTRGLDLRDRDLRYADLGRTDLRRVDLRNANLQGAILEFARLQGADLRGTNLWRALLVDDVEQEALWDHADLREASVEVIDDIDSFIATTTEEIADEGTREAVVEESEAALRGSDRSDLPNWHAQPNVMFDPDDQIPQALGWGQPNWTDVDEYEEELATFFGDLACGEGSSKELAVVFARRVFGADRERKFAQLLAARMISNEPDACPPVAELSDVARGRLKALAARPSE